MCKKMICPHCRFRVNTIGELTDSGNSIPWYKCKEERLRCPDCKTQLKAIPTKSLIYLFTGYFVVCTTLAVLTYMHSTKAFISSAALIAVLSILLNIYLSRAKYELAEYNT